MAVDQNAAMAPSYVAPDEWKHLMELETLSFSLTDFVSLFSILQDQAEELYQQTGLKSVERFNSALYVAIQSLDSCTSGLREQVEKLYQDHRIRRGIPEPTPALADEMTNMSAEDLASMIREKVEQLKRDFAFPNPLVAAKKEPAKKAAKKVAAKKASKKQPKVAAKKSVSATKARRSTRKS